MAGQCLLFGFLHVPDGYLTSVCCGVQVETYSTRIQTSPRTRSETVGNIIKTDLPV